MTYNPTDFEAAVEEFSDLITRICIIKTGNRYDAEDCYQNVFIKLYTKPPRAENSEQLRAWLVTVAVNECRDLHRRRFFRDSVDLDDIAELAMVESEEDFGIIEDIMGLPAIYRDAVYLHYFEGYSISELAGILSCREGTVKSRLARGRALLKTIIEGE